jgi:hypothetical protein
VPNPDDPTPHDQHEAIEELVILSRAAQGLPPKITDPKTLRRVAALLGFTDRSHDQS